MRTETSSKNGIPENQKKKKKEDEDEKDCLYYSQLLLREKFRDAVRDHCHLTGKFRGAAHNVCNRSYFRINPKKTIIPVVFHNLRGCDAHHLMQEIAAVDANLKCIPNNMEKYISFSLGNLRFIDSFLFLLSSLDSLVSSNKPEAFEIINQFETVRHKLPAPLHRHRLTPPRDQDRGCLQRHAKKPLSLRHERFSRRPSSTQPKEQEGFGEMKDECAGEPISEAVCLRSKMYSILLKSDKNIKKAKFTKVVTKKEIQHQHYKDALFNKFAFKHGMDMLRSKDHQIYRLHLNKTTLSPFDS